MRKSIIMHCLVYGLFDYKAVGTNYRSISSYLMYIYREYYRSCMQSDLPDPSNVALHNVICMDIFGLLPKYKDKFRLSEKSLKKADDYLRKNFGMHFDCTREEYKEWLND